MSSPLTLSYVAVPAALEQACGSSVYDKFTCALAPQINVISSARQTCDKVKVTLFRGQSVPAVWNEWQYGGDYASVKSLLKQGKNGWTLRGTNAYTHSVTKEFQKKRYLPVAIEDLIKQGLPEQEALQLVDRLLQDFGVGTISSKLLAFYLKNQMHKGIGKHKELLNKADPGTTVKAFDTAFQQRAQAAVLLHSAAQEIP